MSQRTYRAHGYAALAQALDAWRQLPRHELIALVGLPPSTSVVQVEGEAITLDLAASWANPKHDAVRIHGVAYGPSHWQTERMEESATVSLGGEGKA